MLLLQISAPHLQCVILRIYERNKNKGNTSALNFIHLCAILLQTSVCTSLALTGGAMGGRASTMVMPTGPAGRGQAPANLAHRSSLVAKMGTCAYGSKKHGRSDAIFFTRTQCSRTKSQKSY